LGGGRQNRGGYQRQENAGLKIVISFKFPPKGPGGKIPN